MDLRPEDIRKEGAVKIEDYDHALDTVKLLEDSGITKDPFVAFVVQKVKKDPDDYKALEKFLDEQPHLINVAKSRLHRAERAKP